MKTYDFRQVKENTYHIIFYFGTQEFHYNLHVNQFNQNMFDCFVNANERDLYITQSDNGYISFVYDDTMDELKVNHAFYNGRSERNQKYFKKYARLMSLFHMVLLDNGLLTA